MTISMTKIQDQAPTLVSLVKQAGDALGDANLGGAKARIALVLDYSGSMRYEYTSGAMQELAEKVLALGLQLDDDGAIDLFVFDSDAAHLGQIGLGDYVGSVDRLTRHRSMGSTSYAAAFKTVKAHYFPPAKRGLFGRKPADAELPLPVYALFLTDGAPDNQLAAVNALTLASEVPIFWKFLSIGGQPIPFLQRLDDLTDRTVDNADYQPVGRVSELVDEQLYPLLLEEYAGWLGAVRNLGMIA